MMALTYRYIKDTLLTRKTNNLLVQLFRYAFVGGAAFVLDFGSLWLFTDVFGIYYLVSAAVAFVIGLSVNYALSISWVFDSHTIKNRWIEFLGFALVGVIGLGLNEISMWLFTGLLRFHYLFSKLISTFFVFLWNFLARRFFLFQKTVENYV